MSYERDRRYKETSHGPSASRTSPPIGPGKVTLTEALTGGMVQRKSMSRDISPAGGAGGDSAADTAGPAGAGGAGGANFGGGGDFAATVVGSTADSEVARDGAFTPALVTALHANPNLSVDDVLRLVSATPLGKGTDNGRGLQHPTIVQYGQKVQNTSEPRDPKKHAVLIANKNYTSLPRLGTPIIEAAAMKGELESRGYDANVHTDKSAADMGSLWDSMLGSANPGDDLVAFYGGHGMPEGLAGIHHSHPPQPPDIFTRSQVSGVVSAATGKSAHIRFVMDSCYAGSAVQAVREERQNELAAVAGSVGDQLRVAALAGLQQTKQRLLAFCEQREAAYSQLDSAIQQQRSSAPAPAGEAATRDIDAEPAVENAFERALDQMWAEVVPLLNIVRTAVRHAAAPPPISDYHTLGAQLNYLDDLWSSVSQSMERATARPGAAAPSP